MNTQQSSPIADNSAPFQSPNPSPITGHPSPYDPDEINLLEYIYVLVKNKHWIIGATLFGLVFGYVAALIKGPLYVAEAVIAAKESENAKTPNLSGFGALGGLVATQLNISGSPGLDKIELILDSRKFNAELIEQYDLLPMIYQIKWPKVYRKFYDTTQGAWKQDFEQPKMLGMGAFLKGKYLRKETSKNGTMTLKIESPDSTFSDTLLSYYLKHLNSYIQTNVQSDAKENVAYLENQLIMVADPLLREKLQTLISNEVEKAMLVSKEAFKIIDPQLTERQFKQKKLFPLVFGFGLFFLTTLAVVFGHAFSSGQKTEEDLGLIEGIKREIGIGKKMT